MLMSHQVLLTGLVLHGMEQPELLLKAAAAEGAQHFTGAGPEGMQVNVDANIGTLIGKRLKEQK